MKKNKILTSSLIVATSLFTLIPTTLTGILNKPTELSKEDNINKLNTDFNNYIAGNSSNYISNKNSRKKLFIDDLIFKTKPCIQINYKTFKEIGVMVNDWKIATLPNGISALNSFTYYWEVSYDGKTFNYINQSDLKNSIKVKRKDKEYIVRLKIEYENWYGSKGTWITNEVIIPKEFTVIPPEGMIDKNSVFVEFRQSSPVNENDSILLTVDPKINVSHIKYTISYYDFTDKKWIPHVVNQVFEVHKQYRTISHNIKSGRKNQKLQYKVDWTLLENTSHEIISHSVISKEMNGLTSVSNGKFSELKMIEDKSLTNKHWQYINITSMDHFSIIHNWNEVQIDFTELDPTTNKPLSSTFVPRTFWYHIADFSNKRDKYIWAVEKGIKQRRYKLDLTWKDRDEKSPYNKNPLKLSVYWNLPALKWN